MYAGVPTVDLGWLSSTDLLYPKSQILTRGAGLPSSRVFSNLRSRWHTPCMQSHVLYFSLPAYPPSSTALCSSTYIRFGATHIHRHHAHAPAHSCPSTPTYFVHPQALIHNPAGSPVAVWVQSMSPSPSRTHRLVAVVHPTDQLLEEVACFVLTEATCLDNAVKQLPARCILHDYAQMGGCEVQLQDTTDKPCVSTALICGRVQVPNHATWVPVQQSPAQRDHTLLRHVAATCSFPVALLGRHYMCLTSLKLTTLAFSSILWLRISRSTFLSTCICDHRGVLHSRICGHNSQQAEGTSSEYCIMWCQLLLPYPLPPFNELDSYQLVCEPVSHQLGHSKVARADVPDLQTGADRVSADRVQESSRLLTKLAKRT